LLELPALPVLPLVIACKTLPSPIADQLPPKREDGFVLDVDT